MQAGSVSRIDEREDHRQPRPGFSRTSALGCGKQLGVVRELAGIVAARARGAALAERTWVLISESPDGRWGIKWPRRHGRRHRRGRLS